MKETKGITLIALVITIIILLILAGITISALTNTGIFARANDAKEKTAMAQEDESVKMAVSSATIEGEGELTIENLQDAFTKSNLNGPLTGNGPWTYAGDYGEYDIEKNGNITTTAKGSDNKIIKLMGNYGVTESKKLVKMEMDTQEEKVWKEAKIGEEITEVGRIKSTYDGYNTRYVINSNGDVYAWGNNEDGQLGIGNLENQSTPVKIEGLKNVEKIYRCDLSVFAKTITGEVYAWGKNKEGQLGIGNKIDQSTPVKVETLTNVKEIYYQYSTFYRSQKYGYSIYALTTNGNLYSWGNNDNGMLGIGSRIDQSSPVKIEGLENVKKLYTSSTSSSYAAYAQLATGELYAWGGANGYNVLGIGNTKTQNAPVKVEGLPKVEEIYTYGYSVYVKTTSGEIYVWGSELLGLGDISVQSTPAKIENLKNVDKLYFGERCAYAQTKNKVLYAWGENRDGRLGVGNFTYQSTPTLISDLSDIDDLSATGSGACAKVTTGNIYVWGYNYGKLGIEDEDHQSLPVRIENITNAKEINLFINYAWTILTSEGEVYRVEDSKWKKLEGYGENQKIENLGTTYLDGDEIYIIYTVDGKAYTSK